MKKMKKNILIVVGTRPNFIKITRFKAEAEKYPNLDVKIVHTGQHYDSKMADIFFNQFDLKPDFYLNTPKGSPNSQIGNTILRLEELILKTYKPDFILVPGDVNSTLASSIVANKMKITLGHLESGLRSFDYSMPEEINRIITDVLSDYYFVTEQSGVDNLKNDYNNNNIHFVGNTMIDTMVFYDDKIENSTIIDQLEINNKDFALFTFHRPSNVDTLEGLKKLAELIKSITKKYNIVFPIHPRTISQLQKYHLFDEISNIQKLILSEPLGYFEFQKLIRYCKFVITDSGGIQEETTFRKVPCITVRPNTERPITVSKGTNTLVDFDNLKIIKIIERIENGEYLKGEIPMLWDGDSTKRIMKILNEILI